MAKQVLFIQGGGEGAHDQWDNQLVASLTRALGPAYAVHYPLMPNEADPSYEPWKSAINTALADLPADVLLVAHSIGATILINVLAAHGDQRSRQPFAGVFLVSAPFVGPGGWPSDDIQSSADLGKRLPPNTPVYLYHGSADETAPTTHVDLYKQAIPSAHVRKLKDRDHQLNNDLSEVAGDILSLR